MTVGAVRIHGFFHRRHNTWITMLHFLESRDVYVSSGSACSRGETSHTLTAMGLPKSRVDTALRVSFSGESTPEDVRALLDALAEGMRTLAKIRR